MKFTFARFTGQLGVQLLSWLPLLAVMLVPFMVSAQLSSITFNSPVGPTPPNVDATNFLNRATWNILTGNAVSTFAAPPYQTSDTLNYTNEGTMASESGWNFDFSPSLGYTTNNWSANFFNDNSKIIEAVGYPYYLQPNSSPAGLPPFIRYVDYLWISATNIINKGTLLADGFGEIKLTGSNVNLSRSSAIVSPVSALGSSQGQGTNFTPDAGIYDEYWAQTNRSDLDSGAVWDGLNAAMPPHVGFAIAEPCGGAGTALLSITPAVIDSITNQSLLLLVVTNSDGSLSNVLVATNIFKQAVFVSPGNNIGDIRFMPTGDTTNLFEVVTVRLTSATTGDAFYLQDALASDPRRGLLPNDQPDPAEPCGNATYRPTNYIVARIDPGGFAGGTTGDGIPPTNFLYDTTWTNRSVTAAYAAYDCLVDNHTWQPPELFGVSSVTNLPGRIRITADTLNLTNAQLQADGEIVINANHLISSQNAVMNCENLSYNLGSVTNFSLTITNLALPTVARFNGTAAMSSAVWSNLTFVITPNYSISNNITTNSSGGNVTNTTYIYSPLTNTVQINLYALVLDGSALSSLVPVSVYDLILHSTNMVVNDSMSVIQSFLLDGVSFTLNGNLTFPGVSPVNPVAETPYTSQIVLDWTSANAPTLRYFTNNGSLSLPNEAHFGDDGPTNYAVFVNAGTISAYIQMINSDYFEDDGALSASGGFYLTTGSGKFNNGQVNAGSDIQFNAGALKFAQSSVQTTGGELDFSVTTSLSDGGGGSGNQFACENGFNLWNKPATGDLLGSTFTTVVPGGDWVTHNWAGLDYGLNNAGYSNNVALGTLVLSPQSLSLGPIFEFSGTGTSNGLYVDYLDLSHLGTNFANVLQIDPNLVIYYAAAKLGFTPPPAGPGLPPQEAEEYLDGQFSGHLRWVKTFAGPNSSVAVVINGQSYQVNRALRFATTIDSNGNGIPNYADPNPFSTPPLTLAISLAGLQGQTQSGDSSPPAVAISWLAASDTVYSVQFATNVPFNWQPLLTYTNNVPSNRVVTIFDTNAPTIAPKRFYRTGYNP